MPNYFDHFFWSDWVKDKQDNTIVDLLCKTASPDNILMQDWLLLNYNQPNLISKDALWDEDCPLPYKDITHSNYF